MKTKATGIPSRLSRRLLIFVWGAFLMSAAMAKAEPVRTLVQDTLYRADGSVAQGTLTIRWHGFATGAGEAVPAGVLTTSTDINGGISIALIPNAGSTPAGTYYQVVLKLDDGTTSEEQWVVPVAATTTVAAIRAKIVPLSVAAQFVSVTQMDQEFSALAKVAMTGNYNDLVDLPANGTGGLSGAGGAAGAVNATSYSVNGVLLASGNLSDTAVLARTMTANTFTAPETMPDAITSKTPAVDVRAFGAVCNASIKAANVGGWNDDSTAIQAALEYVNSYGGQLYFPPLPLVCYSSVPLIYKGQSMGGAGKERSFVRGNAGQDVFYATDPLDGGISIAQNAHIHDMSILVDDSVDATQVTGWVARKRWAGQNSLFANQKWTNALAGAMDAGVGAGGTSTSFTVATKPPADYNPINPQHKAQSGCVQIDAEVLCYTDAGPNLATFGGETDTITNVASTATSAMITANNKLVAGQYVMLHGLTNTGLNQGWPVTAATATTFTIGQSNLTPLPVIASVADSGVAISGQLLRGQFGSTAAAHSNGATVTAVNPFTGATPTSAEGLTEDWPAFQVGACGLVLPKRDCASTASANALTNSNIENVVMRPVGLSTVASTFTSCGMFTQRQPYRMSMNHVDLAGMFGFVDEYPAANPNACIGNYGPGAGTMDTASFTDLRINSTVAPFIAASGNNVTMDQISIYSYSFCAVLPCLNTSPPFGFPLGLILKNGYTLNKSWSWGPNDWKIGGLYVEPAPSYAGTYPPPYVYSEIDGNNDEFTGGNPSQSEHMGPTVFNGNGIRVRGSNFGYSYANVPVAVINGSQGRFDFQGMASPDVLDNGLGNVITSQAPYTNRNVNLTLARGFSGQVAPDALLQGNVSGDYYSSLADLFILPDDFSSVNNTVTWAASQPGNVNLPLPANDPTVPITGRSVTIAAPGNAIFRSLDLQGAAGQGALSFSAGAGRMPVGRGTFYVIAEAGAATAQPWSLISNGGTYQVFGSSTLPLTTTWAIYSFPYNTSAALTKGNQALAIQPGTTSPATTVSIGGMMFVPNTDTINAGTVNAGLFAGALAGNVTGNVVGNITGNVTGSVTGSAGTAAALAGTPLGCTLPQVATGIAANGNASCAEPSNSSGNAGTATALASTPTNCTLPQVAMGIAANGNAICGEPSNSTGAATLATGLTGNPSISVTNATATGTIQGANLNATASVQIGGIQIKTTNLADVSSTAPANGQVPTWNMAASQYVPVTPVGSGVTSVNSANGVLTFTGSGVSQAGNTFTFAGSGTVPASAPLLGSNGSNQLVAVTALPAGVSTTFWTMGPDPSSSYASSQPIFVPAGAPNAGVQVPMALTIPANGTNAQGSSTCNLGTLPAANWTVTFYHIGGTTAGCAGSSTAMGTDTISASGAQSWSLTSTTFAPGDCLGAKAQSSVDSLAAYLQCSIVVVK